MKNLKASNKTTLATFAIALSCFSSTAHAIDEELPCDKIPVGSTVEFTHDVAIGAADPAKYDWNDEYLGDERNDQCRLIAWKGILNKEHSIKPSTARPIVIKGVQVFPKYAAVRFYLRSDSQLALQCEDKRGMSGEKGTKYSLPTIKTVRSILREKGIVLNTEVTQVDDAIEVDTN